MDTENKDTVNVYMPDQIEVLKIVYHYDDSIINSLKIIGRIYSKIDDSKSYSKELKSLNLKYDKEQDLVYKVDFFDIDKVNDVDMNDNLFYSSKIFNDWIISMNGIKRFINNNEDIETDNKIKYNMDMFEIKKELLKIIEVFKKKEKENPLGAIFGFDISEEDNDYLDLLEDSLI